jgi:hypothetical protein
MKGMNYKMIENAVDKIRRERATFLHEIAFLREMANEDVIADRVDVAESQYVKESLNDLKDALAIVKEMPDDDNDDQREINTILEATEDLTFDEMLGLRG